MRIFRAFGYATAIALIMSTLASLTPICNSAEAKRSTRSTQRRTTTTKRHHTRHHVTHSHKVARKAAAKPRYAYPLDIFMMRAPEQDFSPLSGEETSIVHHAFQNGIADNYSPQQLVKAGVAHFYPLRGGIFKRRENVKYIIVHSTETGVPQESRRVIDSWSSAGRRHPGAQYCVDRDGTIWESVDPEYATVHVNIFKTLPGINNDNSIGIEMCHAGKQTYPGEQKTSVMRLVTYLQDRYNVTNENVITHRYAQQGDHTDPVAFDWEGFLATKDAFRNHALATKRRDGVPTPVTTLPLPEPPTASVYLEMHKTLKQENGAARKSSVQQVENLRQTIEAAQEPNGLGARVNYLDYSQVAQPRNRGPLPIRGEIEVPPDAVHSIETTP